MSAPVEVAPVGPTEPPAATGFAWIPVAVLTGTLLVIGALLGLIWSAWSPPGPIGAIFGAGTQADETEAFISGDGRFALLTAIVGVLAGVGAWYLRRQRGVIVALALAAGGVGGALLTDLIGHLVHGSGPVKGSCGKGCIVTTHLPLWVQMHGLLFVEGALAVLVYSLFVAFAVSDDLGLPDPARDARIAAKRGAAAPSVGPQGGVQYPGSDGDRAGLPYQDDFAPQHPDQPLQPPGGGGLGQQ